MVKCVCEHSPDGKQNRQTYLLRCELVFFLCTRVPSPLCPFALSFLMTHINIYCRTVGMISHLSVQEFNIQLPPTLGLSMHVVKGYFAFISTWRKDNYHSALHVTMSLVSWLCANLKRSCTTLGIKDYLGKDTTLAWKSWPSDHWWMRVYSGPETLMFLWSSLVLCGWPVPERG